MIPMPELDHAKAELMKNHPAPWYLERCNARGVEVRDTRGDVVFSEEFDAPPELGAHIIEAQCRASIALARYLVAMSNDA
jgi:hypothetical protein